MKSGLLPDLVTVTGSPGTGPCQGLARRAPPRRRLQARAQRGAKQPRQKGPAKSRWAERASLSEARRRRRSQGGRLWEGGGGGGGHPPPRPGSKRPRPGRYPGPHRHPLAELKAWPEPTRRPQPDSVHFPLTFPCLPNSPEASPPPPQPPQWFPPGNPTWPAGRQAAARDLGPRGGDGGGGGKGSRRVSEG